MRTFLLWAILILSPAMLMAEEFSSAFLADGTEYFSDRLIVTTQVGVQQLNIDQAVSGIAVTGVNSIDYLCAQYNVSKVEPYYKAPVRKPHLRELLSRMYVFYVPVGTNIESACQTFRTTTEIECADIWDIPHTTYFPNDPSRTSQWHLGRVEAYEAWDLFRGDTTSYGIVGVVDTGVYHTHLDLAPNMWINTAEDINGNGQLDSGDNDGIDDDGNGYNDDVVGWDMGQSDNNPQEITPTHGTHVAGCASEATDNSRQGAGVGFSVRIMAVKGTNAQNSLTAVYPGMIYAADNGAHVINCSWGSASYSQSNQNTINNIWNDGVVVVAAAGNDGVSTRFYPAAYNHVVAVAATTSNDQKASFSNYGTWIDIAAPGAGIYSTWAQNSMSTLDGTSMASPIVSGITALVKAAHPDWTNEDLVNTILTTADNIDAVNPSYIGQLGSGRVNAFVAIGSGNYPLLQVTGQQDSVTTDDGDGVLNPGESCNLVLTVSNLWADAHGVSVFLTSPSFIFTDSAAVFGDILHGDSASNASEPFQMTALQNLTIGNQHVIVHMTTSDSSYSVLDTVQVAVTLNQRGFPSDLPGNIDSSPIITDIDGDGSNEIVVGCMNQYVYVINADGSVKVNWPQPTSGDLVSGPAVADIDRDGVKEVVALTKDGRFWAWHANGTVVTGFPVVKGGQFYGGPLLIDLNLDGNLEIVAGSFTDNKIYAITSSGADLSGWPSIAYGKWYGSPSAGDIDNDGLDEIIYAGFDSTLRVLNTDGSPATGFPVHLDGQVWAAASVGNVDGVPGLEIAAVTYSGSCFLVNSSGAIMTGFPVHYNSSSPRSAPSLVDLNNDGDLEIIFGTTDARVHALDYTGAEMTGFPIVGTGSIFGTPVVGDVSGDGQPDIFWGTLGGNIYGYDRNGVALQYFPMLGTSSKPISASLALGDLDGDGDMEIVVPIKELNGNLIVIDYKQDALTTNLKWPCFGHDGYRSHNPNGILLGVDDNPATPAVFSLNQNYPNPFNARTSINFSLKSEGDVTLSVFDILGRKIKVLQAGKLTTGEHSLIWDGSNESGATVTSGIYFYRLDSADGSITKRMVMLK
jgi:subtilisin family serine protease